MPALLPEQKSARSRNDAGAGDGTRDSVAQAMFQTAHSQKMWCLRGFCRAKTKM
jgi:hypothetical protein